MRLHRSAFVFAALLAGGSAVVACTGDDNSLPLPPDAGGADAKAGDAGGDATTERPDGSKPDAGEADATNATDATEGADGASPDADGVDAGVDAVADAAPDATEVLDAADDGG
jgi:hypothetical protein